MNPYPPLNPSVVAPAPIQHWRSATAVLAAATLTLTAGAAETLTDDFASSLDPARWQVIGATTEYTIDDSQGDLRFSKSVGGDYSLQIVGVKGRFRLRGDFDVQVEFRNAAIDRLDGDPGNQVQLGFHFGGQSFYVVRSDEAGFGHNAHVYLKPPSEWRGPLATSATSGILRVVRVGVHVSGFFDTNLLYEADYNTNDASLEFALQNNGTRDATAVTFDNFSATADDILPPRFSVNWFTVDGGGGQSAGQRFSVQGTIGQPDAGGPMTGSKFSVRGGFWPLIAVQTPGAPTLTIVPAGTGMARISWAPNTPGFVLQETLSLSPTNWGNSASGTNNPVTVAVPGDARFYRLFKP